MWKKIPMDRWFKFNFASTEIPAFNFVYNNQHPNKLHAVFDKDLKIKTDCKYYEINKN